jgi:hypothetical protein
MTLILIVVVLVVVGVVLTVIPKIFDIEPKVWTIILTVTLLVFFLWTLGQFGLLGGTPHVPPLW